MIYFIQSDDGPIKIGWTIRSVENRLATLQIGTHHKLSILATLPGGKYLEKEIQEKFKDIHIRGEWYKNDKNLLNYIDNNASSHEFKEDISWQKLCRFEPGLRNLEKRCYRIKDNAHGLENFCANALWYGYSEDSSIRSQLSEMVGWSARRGRRYPLLKTSEAYDYVYEKLYNILPDCNHRGGCVSRI